MGLHLIIYLTISREVFILPTPSLFVSNKLPFLGKGGGGRLLTLPNYLYPGYDTLRLRPHH